MMQPTVKPKKVGPPLLPPGEEVGGRGGGEQLVAGARLEEFDAGGLEHPRVDRQVGHDVAVNHLRAERLAIFRHV